MIRSIHAPMSLRSSSSGSGATTRDSRASESSSSMPTASRRPSGENEANMFHAPASGLATGVSARVARVRRRHAVPPAPESERLALDRDRDAADIEVGHQHQPAIAREAAIQRDRGIERHGRRLRDLLGQPQQPQVRP